MDQLMTENESPRTLKTVETNWEIIHLLEERNGARVTEIAETLDLPKSTVSNHLSTLKKHRYVANIDGEYRLSLYFLNLGEYVRNRNRLYQAGREEIERLAQDTEEYTHLVAKEYGRAIYLHEARGKQAVGEDYFSKKFETPVHLHSSAYGKAILAYLPTSHVERVIHEHGLPKRTENTITTAGELFEELAQIREQGFALNDEEELRGMRAVGAPVQDGDGNVLGALSVSKPTSRMKDEEFRKEIPELAVSTANVIEVNIETAKSSATEFTSGD